MNTEELEQRLDGGHETQTFEIKAAMSWDHKTLAKDILAMSNVRDGGIIVVGVEDGTFARQGVTGDQARTFDEDVMRDQMAMYADPHVDFMVEFPTDRRGLRYVVIRVQSFREIPVVCRKNSNDTKEGAIYYRTTNRRVQSAAVNNSYDMREIITVAAMRTRARLLALGAVPAGDPFVDALDDELEGL